MVVEDKLSGVLSEFARTLATDFPIQGILDHLVGRIVAVLPISAAGVTLITAGKAPRYVAASDESALRFERLQTEIGQGPCLSAYELGEAISAPDLGSDDRWPEFAPAAIAAGLAAVFTFPLRQGAGRLGALDLYRETPGALDPQDMSAAQTLADVAAAYLINAEARELARTTSEGFRFSATHDALTGLPNRRLLQQRLEDSALRAQRSRLGAAILFVDLDRFKHVNDTHGHVVGDELLLAVSQRLATLVRPGDTLARFSGDEFVFLYGDLHNLADAVVLAERVEEAFTRSYVLGSTEIAVTASIGLSYSDLSGDDSTSLLEDADVAMYQAKRKGGGRHQLLDVDEAFQSQDRVSLETDLRTAFARGHLDVAYQPIVRTSDGLMTGVEALLRWEHPARGTVPALSMVAVAEQSGLISEIGTWILERACRHRGQWLHDHPGTPLDISVNVSARQLTRQDFTATVAAILNRTGMDSSALVLEMTENIFIEDSEYAMKTLTDLKALGVRLALDDFGTGYSSLNYLRRLPIDIVKIDQCFIHDIDDGGPNQGIVEAVTLIAKALDLTVTAEGVETQNQRDKIDFIGCQNAQGYYYARPMTAPAIATHLAGPVLSTLRLPVPG